MLNLSDINQVMQIKQTNIIIILNCTQYRLTLAKPLYTFPLYPGTCLAAAEVCRLCNLTQIDGQTAGQTDRWTDRWTDGQTQVSIEYVPD